MRERRVLNTGFIEESVWRLPQALSGSIHSIKCRLAYVGASQCVLRYDNEAGKGDHRHVADQEMPYLFVSVDQLLDASWLTLLHGWTSETGAVAITVASTESSPAPRRQLQPPMRKPKLPAPVIFR